jgi:2-dehydro-3-deoxyphosphogluconate aldolase/(4S)-4-hydroxy-2-oxoglutarate aldolase
MVAGVATPMDALRAHRAGAPYQKLFPIPSNPAVWIRSCLGPMPFLRIVPTSGATPENAAELLGAGAHALGFVQPIFEPGAMARHDWDAVRANAERCLAAVHDAIGAPA